MMSPLFVTIISGKVSCYLIRVVLPTPGWSRMVSGKWSAVWMLPIIHCPSITKSN